ncbi:MATE efflux family protein [Williamsoniiplasma somnilux]|uniref:Probable multidrug resistance protein NorM n=1 Tax=Williamsoniiplasma somnilux TaxID=215578 RepID=A0A2K8NXP3_9MOLU|nr:MATE family efflux transporter [Williamsoniiplasma somnilux]ATZ18557.1 MATE efflux family protein [Williamsoniiplasma somnilux]
MFKRTRGEKKNRWFASRAWYVAALSIILWAILQEIIMASTDIVDNIFVNFLKDDQVKGLSGLNDSIKMSGFLNLTVDDLINAGLSESYLGLQYKAGQIAVNGVTASNQMYMIMFCAVSGFCYGCGIYSAQYFGAKDYNKLKQVTALKMYVVFAITFVFAIMTIPGITRHIIEFTTEPKYADKPTSILAAGSDGQDIKAWFNYFQYQSSVLATDEGVMYYQIIAPSYLILVINETAITSLRETRRPFISFWMSLIALSTNCLMNVFLTAPTFLGSFGGLGVQGTAIATFSARILQMIFIVALLSIKRYEFIPGWYSFKIQKNVFSRSMKKASPLLMNELLFAFAAVLQVKLKGMYSVEALTANAIFSTITTAIFSPLYHGLNAGITVFVGNSLGANKLDEAQFNARYLLGLGLVIAVIASSILIGMSYVIPQTMFSSANAESQRIAFWMLFIYAFIYPATMVANAAYSILRAGGAVWSATLLDGVFNWSIEIPVLAILILLTVNGVIHLDIIYIHLAVTACEIFKAIWGLAIYSRKRWVNNLTIEVEKPSKFKEISNKFKKKEQKVESMN